MIRILLFLAILSALAFGFAWVADLPGGVTLTLGGYRYETSLVAALALALAALGAAMLVWSVLRFIFRIPGLMSFAARMRRRNKGLAALSRGMLAVGAGDRRVAARAAREAERLLEEEPLTLLLAAQAAQLDGDRARAERLFLRMSERPDTQILGLRGLHGEARRRGDDAAADAYARRAHELAAPDWASQAMLERAAMSDDWKGALTIVEASAARKAIDRESAKRQRAALKTAMALELRERDPIEALSLAREAIRLNPALIPASVLAGALLSQRGEFRRAAKILESAWRIQPHPDLARAYVEVRRGDSASDRLARAKTLARIAPGEAESALALARAALEARDFALARRAMADLFGNGRRPTQRMCLTMADIEETEHGPSGRVREWLARAARAARDPAWVADGVTSDEWLPASPATGRIDAFVWETPVERLGPGGAGRLDPASQPPILDAEPATPDDPPAETHASPGLKRLAALQATLEGARAQGAQQETPQEAGQEAGQEAPREAAKEPHEPAQAIAPAQETAQETVQETARETAREAAPKAEAPFAATAAVGGPAGASAAGSAANPGSAPVEPAPGAGARPAASDSPPRFVTAPDDPGPDAPDPAEVPVLRWRPGR